MKHLLKISALALATALFASTAGATTILVGEFPSANSGDATEKKIVRDGITAYNAINNPDLPQLFGAGNNPSLLAGWVEFQSKTKNTAAFIYNEDEKIVDWTAPTGYSSFYILTKWGQGQANFDTAVHYLNAGDNLRYNPGDNSAPNGLSHVWIWAFRDESEIPPPSVPDSGATVALLGLGLVATGFARRFLK